MNKSLSIVIPAYNESKRILRTLNDIDSYITKISGSNLFKVIVVNDGSRDNTNEVVNNWIKNISKNKNCFSVISYEINRGKGYAVREAFKDISTELVLYTDADGASPIEEIEKLLPWIDQGHDVVVGSRVLKDEVTKVKMSFKRRFIGFSFHLILATLNLATIRDTQCGFKLYKKNVAEKLASLQKCFNYTFDVEHLYLAKRLGYKIKEVGVNWYHVEDSKVSMLRDSIKMFLEVLKVRFIYQYNIKEF
ncbi:MAG: glycosyltransferase family 2 protein [Candidatus Melainabacteria bacterium]|nr:glycosyltransferase family 2 protein [Candidatus Melainabacteria bacterium]